jgi:hypothetical protein
MSKPRQPTSPKLIGVVLAGAQPTTSHPSSGVRVVATASFWPNYSAFSSSTSSISQMANIAHRSPLQNAALPLPGWVVLGLVAVGGAELVGPVTRGVDICIVPQGLDPLRRPSAPPQLVVNVLQVGRDELLVLCHPAYPRQPQGGMASARPASAIAE